VKDVTVVLKIPMPLLLSARVPGYHLQKRKEVLQHVRNTYEQKILKYKMRCRGINSHINIFNGKSNQITNDISYYLQNR